MSGKPDSLPKTVLDPSPSLNSSGGDDAEQTVAAVGEPGKIPVGMPQQSARWTGDPKQTF